MPLYSQNFSTYRVGSRGLRPARLTSNNNLIDRQNCPGSLGGQLNRPLLGYQEIQDALLFRIQSSGATLILRDS
jgi:hypothetical protein